MRRSLLIIIMILSLLLVACNKENNKEEDKKTSVEYEEVIFHLDGTSWSSEGSFRIDSNNELNTKVISIVSKEYDLDKSKFNSDRMFIKNNENNIYIKTVFEKRLNIYKWLCSQQKD